jgi:hypothetical protein
VAKIMFVWPYPNNKSILQKVIQGVDGEDAPVHVVCVLDNAYLEALSRGIVLSDLGKYANRRYEIWEVPVLHPECSDAIAQLLVGRRYGWISCLAGLLRDKFGIRVPWVSTSFDNCSETGLIWLRGQTPIQDLFGIESPMGITPKDLLDETKAKEGVKLEA